MDKFKTFLKGLVINNIINNIIKIIEPLDPVAPHAKNDAPDAMMGKIIFLLLFK